MTDAIKKPDQDSATEKSGASTVPTDWTPEVNPSDGSPVKTVLAPPPGSRRVWVPPTVAEHNAMVDKMSRERYSPTTK